MQLYSKIIFTLCLSILVVASLESDNYELEQLQVLFRHGDRTPSTSEIYDTDPHDDLYKSLGYGQLTKTGKQREYKLGQFLRNRYDAFLNEYRDGEVYAHSSNSYRTKMSLLLVLAGMYPPSPSTSWSDSVNWQPIPIDYDAHSIGPLSTIMCSASYDAYDAIQDEDPELVDIFQKHKDLREHVQNSTNITMTRLSTAIVVHNNLHSSRSMNLSLPDWCTKKDFLELRKLTTMSFKILSRTRQLRRMMAGPLVEQFLDALEKKESRKKVYLYSGHDMNLAMFIHALNITNAPDYPDFGSAIIMEKLRGPDNSSYIRLYFWTGVSEELISLKLNNCEETCPLLDYKKIVQPILPDDEIKKCTTKAFCKPGRQGRISANADWDTQLSNFFAGSDLDSFKYMKDII